jgi:adenosylmethionine-8-amino-7-oxononanoate aminotransferase
MGARLLDQLQEALDGHPFVRGVRGRGLMVGVELAGDPGADLGRRVVAAALERDVWLYPAGSGDPVRDAVLLGPPFIVGDDDLATMVRVLVESVDAAVA